MIVRLSIFIFFCLLAVVTAGAVSVFFNIAWLFVTGLFLFGAIFVANTVVLIRFCSDSFVFWCDSEDFDD
ncbi:MAG: hypothetical protein LBT05_11890 [Planctomycetaceae bacterium]|nr:hypothetical protein [Planctomycetaceae bacterium]